MQSLKPLEIPASNQAASSVIWLHGLGADGYDFAPVVEMLALPDTRFILPHAPERAVTINNGYVMPAWYDLYGLELGSKQDEAGIRQSQAQIEQLIANEISRGIAAEKIVLAGFSQGGAIVLHTGLRHKEPLAGIVALSTYVPLKDQFALELQAANRQIPIFMAHGSFDNVISPQTAKLSCQLLQTCGYEPIWKEYPMAHSVCEQEIDDIRTFLLQVLA